MRAEVDRGVTSPDAPADVRDLGRVELDPVLPRANRESEPLSMRRRYLRGSTSNLGQAMLLTMMKSPKNC